jgi:mannonate dehydratase
MQRATSGGIRIGVGLDRTVSDAQMIQARQMGCTDVVVANPWPSYADGWTYDDLARLRDRAASFDLRIAAIQHTPLDDFDQIRLGLPDREAALQRFEQAIGNMGRAGIPMLAYNWRPNRLYRTGTIAGRGGAEMTAFDDTKARDLPFSHGRRYDADELWATYEYFVRRAVPVAAEAGVMLALHPDDPPGVAVGGVARIMSSLEGFVRAAETAGVEASPGWGLVFCVGCWAEIGGTEAVLAGIRRFGPRGKIGYVHFRDIQGTETCFNECFPGEGIVDMTAVMRTLVAVGFAGVIIDDHAPRMIGDEGWNAKSRAYQTGYLQGLLRAVTDLGAGNTGV